MLYAFLDGKIVGRSSIRHELNDYLLNVGGHIGYAVATPYRNQGIATEILKQSLKYCRDVLKLERVLVTCDDNNIGSYRTIEKNNGILENLVFAKSESVATRRYWIDLIPKVSLREANSADARGIALVHYQSWIETYTGLMPDAILQKITLEGREKLWTMILADPKGNVWVAERDTGEVVGFLSVCPGRDEQYKDYGEIPGLYLLKKYHSQGIGASLLKKGIGLLKDQCFKGVYLWVLKDNSAELFYQKMGGKMDGEKVLEMDGHKLTEVFYIWENYS
jgi:predicted acetyltransferase